jgi:hypothetical protein
MPPPSQQPFQHPRLGIRPLLGTRNPPRRKQRSSAVPEHVPLRSDSKLYLKGLKDCIAGTLNWSYKMELYFGLKGSEVRQLVGYQII